MPLILLVDDHPAVRHAMSLLLTVEAVATCREADDRAHALESVQRERPDLALVDVTLGDDDGLDLVAELHALGIPVLVLSLHEGPVYVKRALAAGARGYLTKREAPHDLVRAIRDVLLGWVLISPRAADRLPAQSAAVGGWADPHHSGKEANPGSSTGSLPSGR